MHFNSPVGLAAGYDKDGTAIAPLLGMGFSFCEIGSVCLRSQPGNPSPRMFRLTEDEGIINQYRFNSLDSDVVEHNFAITRFDNPFERLLVSLPTLNRSGQTRSLGASAPRDLSFAYSGILIPIV
jgi:dihydroorotate dehydrogenase